MFDRRAVPALDLRHSLLPAWWMMPEWVRQMRLRFRGARRRLGRRCASGLLLAMYVVTAAGVPLPTGNHATKSGELFPCMDCPCGCNSAEQCWRSCCCHTLAERMAWAHERGVRPPEYAIDEARQQLIDLCWLDDLAHPPATKTCFAAKANDGKSCCCCHHNDHATKVGVKTASHIVVWRALACGGQSMNWLSAVPTLIAVRHELFNRRPLVVWLEPHTSVCAEGIADEPVVPPPERA
jgi:hypothetical protein